MATATINTNGLGNLENLTSIGNWADAVDQESKLQSVGQQKRTEVIKNGIKTVVDEVTDEKGSRSRVVTTYKVITKKVPRAVAQRKNWTKFGASSNDGPGPNIKTTYVAEEVQMQFVGGRAGQEQAETEERRADAAKTFGSRIHCRICKADDHWSVHCPYKEMYQVNDEDSESGDKVSGGKSGAPGATTGRYMNPYMRGDRVAGPGGAERRSDDFTCRVTNLPEDSDNIDEELRQMFGSVGRVERFYLARDKNTGKPKGFAFVTYTNRHDAEAAIKRFSGYKMQHLILKVEWTKPNN